VENRKDALKAKLAAGRAKLRETIAQLSDADWDRPTQNPEWTARDLLIHLANAEPGLLGRMRRFLDGTSQLPPGFDLNIWNNRQVAKRRNETVASLVGSLDQSREQTLAFLDGLTDEQLDLRGWHASGKEMTLREMFEIMAWHEGTHADDISTARG
jgi:uncharacterized protein (TIGR03083 family)